MIPKIIHCCWFGGTKTRLAGRCLASWRRYAKDWRILERGNDFLSDAPDFAKQAAQAGKWAMVSDWARMRSLWEEGGIYLDFDVELIKPLDDLLDNGEWVAGEWLPDGSIQRNPGGGIALEKGSAIAESMLGEYAKLKFDPNREMMQWIVSHLPENGLKVLPPEVMCPLDGVGKAHITDATHAIHHYAMSDAGRARRIMRWLRWHGLSSLANVLLKMRSAI